MPSHRILLLLRRPAEIRLPGLRRQVAALRRCAGVTDVIIGLRDARGVRLLSPWLFLPADMLPAGIGGSPPEGDLSSAVGNEADGLTSLMARALVAHPLSIRDMASLRNGFSRAVLADPAQWTTAERQALAAELPLLEAPEAGIAPGGFRRAGRIREPGVGGPLRILALNLVEPAGQTLLGRFIYELGRQRRLVELLDHREPTQSAPMFVDDLHVRQLDPQETDQSAEPWHLVVMGRHLPFSARQFAALTARLFLFSRPTVLLADHRPVSVTLDAAKLTFDLAEQAGASHYASTQTAPGWGLSTVSNAHLFADDGSPPKPPLAAWLTLAKDLDDGRSPLSALAAADRFRERFGMAATADELMAARLLAHRQYQPLQDAWVTLSLAADLGRLLAIQQQGPVRQAAFLRFLRRPPESDSDPDAPVSLRKRIDIVRGVVRSGEYTRIAPPAVATATRGLVDTLHEAIASGRSLRDAASSAGVPEAAPSALVTACLALVADRLESSDNVPVH